MSDHHPDREQISVEFYVVGECEIQIGRTIRRPHVLWGPYKDAHSAHLRADALTHRNPGWTYHVEQKVRTVTVKWRALGDPATLLDTETTT